MRITLVIFTLLSFAACSSPTSATDALTTLDGETLDTTEPIDSTSGTDSTPPKDGVSPDESSAPDWWVPSQPDAVDETVQTDTVASVTCPPEDADLLANPPPSDIPAGTCEPQAKMQTLETQVATVQGTSNPSEFMFVAPEAPKGLILFFHGGGGSKEGVFSRIELALFLQEALADGYALVALDSVAHLNPGPDGKFKWDTTESPCNPDIENVVQMLIQLKDPQGLAVVPEDTPIYAFGASNGGSMVSRTAQFVEFSAVASYISNAQQFHDDDAHIPPVFIMAGKNDSTVQLTGPCMLYTRAVNQGVDVVFKLNVMQAITPGLFTRIQGIECEDSIAILEAFGQNNVVDGGGMLQSDPKALNTWTPHLPSQYEVFIPELRDLLSERFGGHMVSSDFIQEQLDFFNAYSTPSFVTELPLCE